jgi:hypothetical protein
LDEEDGGEQLEDGEEPLDTLAQRDRVSFKLNCISSA